MSSIKVNVMNDSREEIIDKTIESEINWLRNGFKVLIMAYWKKDSFEKRYNRIISNVEWERFLSYMKTKGYLVNNIVYELSDNYFKNEKI